jgi:trimeric autotransporter adhesin
MLKSWIRQLAHRTSQGIRHRYSSQKRQRRFTRLGIEFLEDRLTPTAYTVNSLLDVDLGEGDSGTLRYVLNLANTNHTGTAASPDTVTFTTAGGTILVGSGSAGAGLPAIASNEVISIDATTADGYTGTPIITLDGTAAVVGGPVNGFTVSGGSSTIKGFDIISFSGNGIQLDTNGNNLVLSCYIGLTTSEVAAANAGNGVFINGTSGNSIGSTATSGGNVISGNTLAGVQITGSAATPASGNIIVASFLGTNAAGTAAVGNGTDGVSINNGSGNIVGGGIGDGNVISGNKGNGVQISAGSSANTVARNFIGTNAAGTAALGNTLDGVKILNANNNLVGNNDPISSITYYTTEQVSTQPVSELTGIRGADTAGQYLISGISGNLNVAQGLLIQGTIQGVGSSFLVNYPDSATTSVYGPDNQGNGQIGLVGSYTNTGSANVNGFLFQGTTAQLSTPANYQTVNPAGSSYTILHSTNNGLTVGNYDSAADHGMGGLPLGPGHALLYNNATQTFLPEIVFPGSKSNTAYGIWFNGGASYTIAGGYSPDFANNFLNQDRPIGQAFLVDFDSATQTFSHFTSFSYPGGVDFLTHFQGISSLEEGVYTLAADAVQASSIDPAQGSFVTVRRNTDGSFGPATWVTLNDPAQGVSGGVTSSNSVYGNQVVGVVFPAGGPESAFTATVNVAFQLSNVISGNGQNGIELAGADTNTIAMNYIGSDVTGTIDLGNAANGILITAASTSNLIGGEATGGNNPRATPPVFVRPPQGNLISGNDANGVLINGAATQNQLSGNFIGTSELGNSALGNTLDGVAIDSASGNKLIGCTFQQDPFVFYNVIDSNGGNGVRVTDSNDITIQANFIGLGANNSTPLGNALDGVLVDGSSANMQFGGVIPLGNVVAGNQKNGVEIAGTASGGVYFNTFCGLPAFIVIAVPNLLDGFLVSSTGGNNTILTTIISGNGGNGVHITGDASGVQVEQAIIGLDTEGTAKLPNGDNGILIDGTAHDNFIGGQHPSVVPENVISANGANGIAIVGQAHDNQIFHSLIGTNVLGTAAFGNAEAGILIGGTVSGTIIGGTDALQKNFISGNLGDGINLNASSHGTQIFGNVIGADKTGAALANQGAGVTVGSSGNVIGGSSTGMGNTIAFNAQGGVTVDTGIHNGIHENSIFSNTGSGIQLTNNGNQNQPAPVLTGALLIAPVGIQIGVQFSGILTAQPNTAYTIEFFATPTGTAEGQGKSFLAEMSVTTNASGVATFVSPVINTEAAGNTFTATATNTANNNTSVFSAAIPLTGTANSLFIASVYGLLLGRAPDAGATFWVNGLNSGTFTPTTAILGIEGSAEYLIDQVDALYLHYLNRAADPSGQAFWVSSLQHGGTLEQVAEGLVSSPEYFSAHGSTNQGYVLGLYQDVLNRTPTAGEVNEWVTLLNSGTSRSTVATFFLTSAEYRTDLIDADYATFLLRSPDAGGLATWLNAFNAGATDQEVLAAIFGSPEGYSTWS